LYNARSRTDEYESVHHGRQHQNVCNAVHQIDADEVFENRLKQYERTEQKRAGPEERTDRKRYTAHDTNHSNRPSKNKRPKSHTTRGENFADDHRDHPSLCEKYDPLCRQNWAQNQSYEQFPEIFPVKIGSLHTTEGINDFILKFPEK
jgi:hypothetical protein